MKYITELKEENLPLLAQSYMRTFNSAPWFERWLQSDAAKKLEDLAASPNFYGLIAWDAGTPIGAVLGRKEHYFDGDNFQIVELWIERKFQRMGYGSSLMEALEKRLYGKVRSIYLMTMHTPQTIGFYQKNGFDVNSGLCMIFRNLETHDA